MKQKLVVAGEGGITLKMGGGGSYPQAWGGVAFTLLLSLAADSSLSNATR